ncbi:MAG TPA: helix-turn-helix domain-containing protein [Dermatophilaceae bacterium]|nr:helix-turn-helix domain-containing protein [Dermatophilaceae bacterium]HQD01053.1 helix-turn-helix domain-containing protein [Dermatophilaceae bacterium]
MPDAVPEAEPEAEPEPGTPECTVVESVLAFLGRAWAGAVVEALLHGNERFGDIAKAIPEATDGVLSARLKDLCARGLALRDVTPGPPVSVRYTLTAAGRDLGPVLDALTAYGAAHPEVLIPKRPRG